MTVTCAYYVTSIRFAWESAEVVLAEMFARYRRLRWRLRGAVLAKWIRLCGGVVGRNLQVDKRVHLRRPPHSGWKLGDDVYIGVGTILDIQRSGRLELGDSVKIMHYCVLASSVDVRIGAQSQVAEHCSIRDSDHGMDLGRPMREQSVCTPTSIGEDVWIARGCIVTRGSRVGDGVVVGANSVVRGDVPALSVVAGAPARLIRSRV